MEKQSTKKPFVPTTRVEMPKLNEKGNLIPSSSPTKREGGIHPITRVFIRHCICDKPLCRALMWILADINALEYFPYLRLPNEPKPKDGKTLTPTMQHAKACRKNHFHHLYGYGEEGSAKKRDRDGENDLWVALIHYPKLIRDCILSMPDDLEREMKFRVSLAVAQQCGLCKRVDKCPTLGENGETTYFTAPLRRDISKGSEVWNEIAVLVREHNNKCNTTTTTTAAAILPGEPRATPDERKMEQLTRLVNTMSPEEIAKLLFDKDKKIGALEQQVSEEKRDSEKKINAKIKQLENANDLLLKELATSGMSRKSLCNDDFYKSRPDLALHLYGARSWEQHKQIADALFGTDDDVITDLKEKGWDVNVTGEGNITPFEKFNICVMIAKQGFKEETVAAYYGKDRSAINRYKDEWMDKLEKTGANFSELDLGMDQNIFGIEECKRLGVPYMQEGWSEGLLEYLSDDDSLKIEILAREENMRT